MTSRFGDRPPSTTAVVEGIEPASGEVVVANGAAEANALGLTTQVPTREIFLTSGRTRMLHVGKRTVELKHGTRWQLVLGTCPAGRAIRALSWLGAEQASAALKILHGQTAVGRVRCAVLGQGDPAKLDGACGERGK